MTHIVFCQKLKKEAEGLDFLPYPGELGQRIYDHISKEAWKQWLNNQTMLINEYQLNLLDHDARRFIQEATVKYLFES